MSCPRAVVSRSAVFCGSCPAPSSSPSAGGRTHSSHAVSGSGQSAANTPRWSRTVTRCKRNRHSPLFAARSVMRNSARCPAASIAPQGSTTAVPLSASAACTATRSSGIGRRPVLCSCTTAANSSPGRTGFVGSCKPACTSRRSVRASHTRNAVPTSPSASSSTANGARLIAAMANSTASVSPQPTLPAMAAALLRAGTRHGVQ